MNREMNYSVGDLVVVYLMNSSLSEPELLHYGVVMQRNPELNTVLVMDNAGYARWWPEARWQLLSKGS
jgi:hypothetical protein